MSSTSGISRLLRQLAARKNPPLQTLSACSRQFIRVCGTSYQGCHTPKRTECTERASGVQIVSCATCRKGKCHQAQDRNRKRGQEGCLTLESRKKNMYIKVKTNGIIRGDEREKVSFIFFLFLDGCVLS